MANVTPVTRLQGVVHNCSLRQVPAVEAREAERDEAGRITRDAYPAREAYQVLDVTVLTDDGGFALVLLRVELDGIAPFEEALGGVVPERGQAVDWPIRNYITWAGPAGRRFPTVGYSVAGDILVAEHRAKPGRHLGKRVTVASAAS